jgi:hypothetical protein
MVSAQRGGRGGGGGGARASSLRAAGAAPGALLRQSPTSRGIGYGRMRCCSGRRGGRNVRRRFRDGVSGVAVGVGVARAGWHGVARAGTGWRRWAYRVARGGEGWHGLATVGLPGGTGTARAGKVLSTVGPSTGWRGLASAATGCRGGVWRKCRWQLKVGGRRQVSLRVFRDRRTMVYSTPGAMCSEQASVFVAFDSPWPGAPSTHCVVEAGRHKMQADPAGRHSIAGPTGVGSPLVWSS